MGLHWELGKQVVWGEQQPEEGLVRTALVFFAQLRAELMAQTRIYLSKQDGRRKKGARDCQPEEDLWNDRHKVRDRRQVFMNH